MDNVDDEIRQLQSERKKLNGVAFTDVSYDPEFYGRGSKADFDTSIAVTEEEQEQEADEHSSSYFSNVSSTQKYNYLSSNYQWLILGS